MSDDSQAIALWGRAKKALIVARNNLPLDSDTAASRAYYAAFYAVSALFAIRGRTFKKHSALEAAVHRDLIKPGIWSAALGERYSTLMRLRNISDYGAIEHIPSEEAENAVTYAQAILEAVARANPQVFGWEEK